MIENVTDPDMVNDGKDDGGFQVVTKTNKNRRDLRQKQQRAPYQERNVVKDGRATAQNRWKAIGRNSNKTGRGRGRDNRNTLAKFGRSGWSKPTQEYQQQQEEDPTTPQCGTHEIMRWKTQNDIDEATERMTTTIQDEIHDAIDNQDDLINTSLAATAAVTFVTSALGSCEMNDTTTVKNDVREIEQSMLTKALELNDKDSTENIQGDFAAFARGNSLSALMEEFGQADPNWKTTVPDSAVADIDTDKLASSNAARSGNRKNSGNQCSRSMLGTEGKAPIHIQIESFGFVHGAPSRSKRDSGWSPYTQPLGPIDVRHDIDPVPAYLMWHDGINSAQVKRVLMTSKSESQSQGSSRAQAHDGFVQYIKSIASDQILPCLIEAQDVGGHGYVSPLSCKVQIGSELGRHRSVVVAERVAVALRQLLRDNSESKIRQPISVGTFHRDIEKRPPNLKSTRGGDNDDDYDDSDRDNAKRLT